MKEKEKKKTEKYLQKNPKVERMGAKSLANYDLVGDPRLTGTNRRRIAPGQVDVTDNCWEAAARGAMYSLERALMDPSRGFAALTAQDADGRTPLHHAAMHDRRGTLDMLIGLRVPLDVKDSEGRTALHLAVSNNHRTSAKHLVSIGADIQSRDKGGQSVYERAKEISPEFASFIKQSRADFLRKTKEQIEAEKELLAASIVENPHETEQRKLREAEEQSAAARAFNAQFGTKKPTELESDVPLRWGDRTVPVVAGASTSASAHKSKDASEADSDASTQEQKSDTEPELDVDRSVLLPQATPAVVDGAMERASELGFEQPASRRQVPAPRPSLPSPAEALRQLEEKVDINVPSCYGPSKLVEPPSVVEALSDCLCRLAPYCSEHLVEARVEGLSQSIATVAHALQDLSFTLPTVWQKLVSDAAFLVVRQRAQEIQYYLKQIIGSTARLKENALDREAVQSLRTDFIQLINTVWNLCLLAYQHENVLTLAETTKELGMSLKRCLQTASTPDVSTLVSEATMAVIDGIQFSANVTLEMLHPKNLSAQAPTSEADLLLQRALHMFLTTAHTLQANPTDETLGQKLTQLTKTLVGQIQKVLTQQQLLADLNSPHAKVESTLVPWAWCSAELSKVVELFTSAASVAHAPLLQRIATLVNWQVKSVERMSTTAASSISYDAGSFLQALSLFSYSVSYTVAITQLCVETLDMERSAAILCRQLTKHTSYLLGMVRLLGLARVMNYPLGPSQAMIAILFRQTCHIECRFLQSLHQYLL